ncbi:MAG: hypothetical protein D8M57_03725 [Candidatus Scalindua sp. AMX11]|nr:MAG: hypothetical protein DWQ00_10970 [Candidatus Scalindua sp.]TDE66221.1 MAG: hypothetical protein D8M57_03725 [Candidatus Scalindua sp. AMX11]GJQ57842.1 MAG: hypothetical protein SCALA701_06430 [Candidatus Scalindua sp.]
MGNGKMKYTVIIITILLFFAGNSRCFAIGKIVDYFLNNENSWDVTKNIIQEKPKKIVVTGGTEGLGFDLAELTSGDEVSLVFLEPGKSVTLRTQGYWNAEDKLLIGENRVVSVITRNYGDRTKFHYKFKLQRKKDNGSTMLYNNTKPILESQYDGSRPVKDFASLSGIRMCVIEVR